MKFDTKTYDFLKLLAQILLPGFGTCYAAVALIWGLPYPEQIVATIVALDTFLGIILGISTAVYNKTEAAASDGTLKIDTSSPTDIYRFEMNVPLSELGDKKLVTLVVDKKADLSQK